MSKFYFYIVGWLLAVATLASAQPVISSAPDTLYLVNGQPANLTLSVTGNGPFTYQWLRHGTNLPNDTIQTLAGSGSTTYAGDGAAATNAGLYVAGLASGPNGSFYVADYGNSRVRQVSSNGIINTLIGTGSLTFAGDGGPSQAATIGTPRAVIMDKSANFYVTDTSNYRVRKIGPNGTVSTIAGSGTPSYIGDNGPATSAGLNSPYALAVDLRGNLYIAENSGNRIRRVDTNGIITTYAGTNAGGYSGDAGPANVAKLNSPSGLACDAAGNLYIADTGNFRIRKVDTNGIISTLIGTNSIAFAGDGGPGVNATLSSPSGVAVDAYGNLFIADKGNNRVRCLDTNGIISTVVGNGTTGFTGDGGSATNSGLAQPYALAFDADGGLLIADQSHFRVRRATLGHAANIPISAATTNDADVYQLIVSNAEGSTTSSPVNVVIVYAPTITNQPVNGLTTNGVPASFTVTANGTAPLYYQWFLAQSPVTGATNATLTIPAPAAADMGVYYCMVSNAFGAQASTYATLQVLTPPGFSVAAASQTPIAGQSTNWTIPASGTTPIRYAWQFNGTNLPDNYGNFRYIAGRGTQGIGSDGVRATNTSFMNLSGITADAAGNIYVADNNRIRRVTPDGYIYAYAGTNTATLGDGGPATNASLSNPAQAAFDRQGNLFIADSSHNRIRKVDTSGVITTVAGTNTFGLSGDGGNALVAKLNHPSGVAADARGNFYLADNSNHDIRLVNTNGIITSLAGNGSSGFSGDGGPAIAAKLSSPACLALDTFANLYFCDVGNNRIRKIDINGIISTVAGNGTTNFTGDGGAATNAGLYAPNGICLDGANQLYISDYGHQRIRKVDLQGNISTIVCNTNLPANLFSGNATNGPSSWPLSVGLDNNGNLLYALSSFVTLYRLDLGATPTLALPNLTANQVGTYTVTATNLAGTATGPALTLSLNYPPRILTQPHYVSTIAGNPATYNVVAAGDLPLNYQWYTSSGRPATAIAYASPSSSAFNFIMTDLGAGYVARPNVNVLGTNGVIGTLTAQMLGDEVFNLSGVSTFSGYTGANPPTIAIDPPPMVFNALSGQTNNTFNIPITTPSDVTNYMVIVTNNFGSITSAFTVLRLPVPPAKFTATPKLTSSNAPATVIQFTGATNYGYSLYRATNLVAPVNWQLYQLIFTDTNGVGGFTDSNSVLPQAYYWIRAD